MLNIRRIWLKKSEVTSGLLIPARHAAQTPREPSPYMALGFEPAVLIRSQNLYTKKPPTAFTQ